MTLFRWETMYLITILFLFLGVDKVHAFDAGDAIALVLGLVLGICGLLACIGAYARRKNGQ